MELKETKVKVIVKTPYEKDVKVIEKKISNSTWKKIETLLETQDILPKDKLIYHVDNLPLPAEAKAILVKLVDLTVTIGNRVLAIGKKIIEMILYLVKRYPNTTIGLVVGAFLGALISSIPFIGWILSPIITPLSLVLGGLIGLWRDLKDQSLRNEIKEFVKEFEALKDLYRGDR
jgi:hypothetical protein